MLRRPLLLAAVLAAAALAGCLGGSEPREAPAPAPDAQPPTAEPAPDAPTAEPDAEPAPEAEPEPTPPAPLAVHLRHDYQTAAGRDTFAVPEGHGPFEVRLSWTHPDNVQVCSGQDARIVVKDPAGTTFLELKGPTVTLGQDSCSGEPAVATGTLAGTWTVEWIGTGAIVGLVDATASG